METLLEHDVYGEVRIANLMMRYSSVLSELGEFQNCDIVAAEALECFQKNFGELHEQMQWAYLMVGDNYHKAGDKENARRYYDLAIRVLREMIMRRMSWKNEWRRYCRGCDCGKVCHFFHGI